MTIVLATIGEAPHVLWAASTDTSPPALNGRSSSLWRESIVMAANSASAFATWLGVHRKPAMLLERLYAGEPVRGGGAVRLYVHRLRAAMEPEAIDTTSEGYVLLPVGVAECERALRECAA